MLMLQTLLLGSVLIYHYLTTMTFLLQLRLLAIAEEKEKLYMYVAQLRKQI